MTLRRLTLVCAAAFFAASLTIVSSSPANAATAISATESRANVAQATTGYHITIHTADVRYAGTDGNVWIRVNGTLGSTSYLRLDDDADNFERNRTDIFLRSGFHVGTIRSVTIKFDPLDGGSAEWLPDWVRVNGETFENTQWFEKGRVTTRTLAH